MAKLIEELEKAGLINGSYLLYDEENEDNVKKILLKYGLWIGRFVIMNNLQFQPLCWTHNYAIISQDPKIRN